MALTVTNVPNPNARMTELPFGGFKARIVKLTFDSSYLTTGEVLTAAMLGWNELHGAIPITGVGNADGTLSFTTVVRKSGTALTFQLQETAGTVDTPHKELTSTADASAYHGNFLVFGV